MNTYFKSFVTLDHSPALTTYDPKTDSRKISQTLGKVLESELIKPNTAHSQLEQRLCASLLETGYPGTYRSEGLVFETTQNPEYAVPFDLMALTTGDTFTSAAHKHKFLEGSDQFKYACLDDMLKQFPSSEIAIEALNEFRKAHNLTPVNGARMNYNECCFTQDVIIRPIALIGQSRGYQELSEKYNLPLYSSINEFKNNPEKITSDSTIQTTTKPSLYEYARKSMVGAFYRVGSSFALDGMAYLAVTGEEPSKFFDRFQWDKFLSVTAAVIAINFIDYKFDLTNRLDGSVEKILSYLNL